MAQNVEPRFPHRIAEENNSQGVGVLSDEEVAQFSAAVAFLQEAIRQGLGEEWVRRPYSGAGYVITEIVEHPTLQGFNGYNGIRKTERGYALISADERYDEGVGTECARFHDALNAYAARIVTRVRGVREDQLGAVAWMWNGTVGPGVAAERLPGWSAFRFFLRENPEVWIEGSMMDAAITHGFSMTFAQFVSAIVTHPKVTRRDATAWPQ